MLQGYLLGTVICFNSKNTVKVTSKVQGGVIRYTEGVSIRYTEGASIRYRAFGKWVSIRYNGKILEK